MREIVLDTETTGLDPADGHRIIEICCLELEGHLPTGKVFHTLIHPERDIPEDSLRVHGLTAAKLSSAPVFAHIADEFLAFVADAPLIIHNAEFDLKFLNWELQLAGKPALGPGRGIDTIAMAKKRFHRCILSAVTVITLVVHRARHTFRNAQDPNPLKVGAGHR